MHASTRQPPGGSAGLTGFRPAKGLDEAGEQSHDDMPLSPALSAAGCISAPALTSRRSDVKILNVPRHVPNTRTVPVELRLLGPIEEFDVHWVDGATEPCWDNGGRQPGEEKRCPYCLQAEANAGNNRLPCRPRRVGYAAAEVYSTDADGCRTAKLVVLAIPKLSLSFARLVKIGTLVNVTRRGKTRSDRLYFERILRDEPAVNRPFDARAFMLGYWFPKGVHKNFDASPPIPLDDSLPRSNTPSLPFPDDVTLDDLYGELGTNTLAGVLDLVRQLRNRDAKTPAAAAGPEAAIATPEPADDANRWIREQCEWHGSSLDAHGRRREVNEACVRVGLTPFAASHAAERALAAADYDALSEQLAHRGEPAAATIVADTRRRRFTPPDAEPVPDPTPGKEPSNCPVGDGPASPQTPGSSSPTPDAGNGRPAEGVARDPGLFSEPADGGGPAPRPEDLRTALAADATRTAPRADAPPVVTTIVAAGRGGGSAPVCPGRAGPRGRSLAKRLLAASL